MDHVLVSQTTAVLVGKDFGRSSETCQLKGEAWHKRGSPESRQYSRENALTADRDPPVLEGKIGEACSWAKALVLVSRWSHGVFLAAGVECLFTLPPQNMEQSLSCWQHAHYNVQQKGVIGTY